MGCFMECVAEREVIRSRRAIDLLTVFLTALFFAGAFTGTVVFSRSYSDGDVAAFIDSQCALPVDRKSVV